MADEDLTPAELAFRAAVRADDPKARSVSREYSEWAQRVRAKWLAARPEAFQPPSAKGRRPKKQTPKPLPKWDGIDESD